MHSPTLAKFSNSAHFTEDSPRVIFLAENSRASFRVFRQLRDIRKIGETPDGAPMKELFVSFPALPLVIYADNAETALQAANSHYPTFRGLLAVKEI